MLKKLRFLGYFFILGILPKFFNVPHYFKYFFLLIILIWADDFYNYFKNGKNK
jgi:CDP-diglyceride synthetase